MGSTPSAPFGNVTGGSNGNVTQVDPTPPWFQQMQQLLGLQQGSNTLNLLSPGGVTGQANPFMQMASQVGSPLQDLGTSQMAALQSYNPEAQAYAQNQPALNNLTNADAMRVGQVQNPYTPQPQAQMPGVAQNAYQGYDPNAAFQGANTMGQAPLQQAPTQQMNWGQSLSNPFQGAAQFAQQAFNPAIVNTQQSLPQQNMQQQQNPYQDLGFMNQAQNTLAAYQPVWEHNLQAQHANLANSAASPYSTAYAQQGAGLDQNALNDYNLFAQQTMNQGLQNQSQNQQANLNFMLGAQGTQNQAIGGNQQAQLAQGGLGLQGVGQQVGAMQNAAQQQGAFDTTQQGQQQNFALQSRGLQQQAIGQNASNQLGQTNALTQLGGAQAGAQIGAMNGQSQFNLGQQQQMNDFTLNSQNLAQQREQNAANFMLQNQNQYQTGNLAARQLQQQGALGAVQTGGALASAAGNDPYNRALQTAQTGANIYQNQYVNPTQTLLANAQSFANPTGMQGLANPQQPSTFQNVAGGATALGSILTGLGNYKSGSNANHPTGGLIG